MNRKQTSDRRKFLKTTGLAALTTGLGSCATSEARVKSTKRIMVAKFFDETNTFIPENFTLEMAKKRAVFGDDVLNMKGMVHGVPGSSVDGFMDVMKMFDVTLIGSISVNGDYRLITEEVFDFVTGHMLQTLDQHEVDGVYLSLHGAGVTEGHDDLEGDTLELIREKVGPDIPIVYTLDLHSTLTDKMAKNANAVSIYRTYPHIDAYDVGYEVGAILMGTLLGNMNPVISVKHIPLLIGPPLNVVTADMPIRQVYDRAREMQRTIPGVLTCCPAQGFMQQDVPGGGAGVMVTTDGDPELGQRLADELAEMMFSFRKDYWIELPGVSETIQQALKSQKPVAIADSGDNIGGGGSGDGTYLLHEILKQKVKSAFVQIYHPEAAVKAFEAGVGANITLDVGAWSSPINGQPVNITGQVTKISREGDPWHKAARIDLDGVTVLLNTRRIGPNDQTNVRGMGIYPEEYQMTVCKGSFAFRPQYPESVFNYIMSATPGYVSADLSTFEWKHIQRPVYPLDEI
ncbi:MAG: microcystinase C [Cyclobacteriaceae bacterium]|nr:MAG: microcystinase C [Cyclobacteriaceae bacterium]